MSEVDKKVKSLAAKAIIGLVAIGLLSDILIGYFGKLKVVSKATYFKSLLIYSSIALVFVGLTEFVFATPFAVKFMALDINYVKKSVFSKLIEIIDRN